LGAKISLGLGQIYFVRAVFDGGERLAKAETEFDRVVQAYEDGNQDLSDLAGHAYARQGAIARLKKDYPTSAERYHKAIELVCPYYQARYWGELGGMHSEACEIELATQAYEQARDIAGDTGDHESAELYQQELEKLEQGCPTAAERRDCGL
jgi:tetratricopeptide (TPR) repeat protein